MSRAHIRRHVIRLLACLSLVFLAGSTVEAAATMNPLDTITTVTPGPVLTGASCTGEGQGFLMVTGEQFTPGGEVAVVLFMPDKADPAVTRAIRASPSIFGPNGSTDPARGFQSGGFVGIALGSWCQEARMVRAYDLQRGTWSNRLNVDLSTSPGADGRRQKGAAVPYHLIELERGTRSESSHAAAQDLDRDLRVDLAVMAAAQYRRPVVK